MTKRTLYTDKNGMVIPPRDVFIERPGTQQVTIDVPEDLVVEHVVDGVPVDHGGNPLVVKKAAAKKKAPQKKAPVEKFEDMIDELDSK